MKTFIATTFTTAIIASEFNKQSQLLPLSLVQQQEHISFNYVKVTYASNKDECPSGPEWNFRQDYCGCEYNDGQDFSY